MYRYKEASSALQIKYSENMWHSILAYSKYLSKAKTKFSVHSPFVYEFITKAFETPLASICSLNLKLYRNELLSSSKQITVSDFGAGSKIFKSNRRKVKAIAKYAGLSKTKAELLQKIVTFFQPSTILEVGTSLGIGTAALHFSSSDSKITSIEGCPETASVAKEMFHKYKMHNINLIVGEFSEVLSELFKKNTFDLIFFDGNHQKEATIEYFESCLQSTHNDTLLIFDDIHWSKGMEEAWLHIQKSSEAKVSIDLFHFGLVFFRKEQIKQDFILRY